jgi:hypothetical protein
MSQAEERKPRMIDFSFSVSITKDYSTSYLTTKTIKENVPQNVDSLEYLRSRIREEIQRASATWVSDISVTDQEI